MPVRGKFTFPPPYRTEAVRLTNASDCGGRDCVDYIGYSYWRRTNNHVGRDTMLVLVVLDRNRGGAGPTLFQLVDVSASGVLFRRMLPVLPEPSRMTTRPPLAAMGRNPLPFSFVTRLLVPALSK